MKSMLSIQGVIHDYYYYYFEKCLKESTTKELKTLMTWVTWCSKFYKNGVHKLSHYYVVCFHLMKWLHNFIVVAPYLLQKCFLPKHIVHGISIIPIMNFVKSITCFLVHSSQSPCFTRYSSKPWDNLMHFYVSNEFSFMLELQNSLLRSHEEFAGPKN